MHAYESKLAIVSFNRSQLVLASRISLCFIGETSAWYCTSFSISVQLWKRQAGKHLSYRQIQVTQACGWTLPYAKRYWNAAF